MSVGTSSPLDRIRDLVLGLRSSPFYAARLSSFDVPSLEAFASDVPLLTKAELVADQASNPPFGSLPARPIEDFTRLHQTSATTGSPLRWLDTPESWDAIVEDWVEILRHAGVTPTDRVLAAFSFGPFIGFWMGFEAATRLGCLTIPGGSMQTRLRLRVIEANRVSVVMCTPTYAIRLAEDASTEGIDIESVRVVIVAGEPGGSVPAVRRRLERLWPGATIFDHHGMTEIGPATYQCPDHPGVLHLLEDSLYCEFLDPATGEAVEPGREQSAELVVTTLKRAAMPVLRYRTGDLVVPGRSCPCGRPGVTLEGGIVGRLDDMLFIRGVNLHPANVDDVIRGHDEVAEYQVDVRERRGMSEVTVRVEPHAGTTDPGALCRRIEEAFHETLQLRIQVEPASELPRYEFKARRWNRHDVPG